METNKKEILCSQLWMRIMEPNEKGSSQDRWPPRCYTNIMPPYQNSSIPKQTNCGVRAGSNKIRFFFKMKCVAQTETMLYSKRWARTGESTEEYTSQNRWPPRLKKKKQRKVHDNSFIKKKKKACGVRAGSNKRFSLGRCCIQNCAWEFRDQLKKIRTKSDGHPDFIQHKIVEYKLIYQKQNCDVVAGSIKPRSLFCFVYINIVRQKDFLNRRRNILVYIDDRPILFKLNCLRHKSIIHKNLGRYNGRAHICRHRNGCSTRNEFVFTTVDENSGINWRRYESRSIAISV